MNEKELFEAIENNDIEKLNILYFYRLNFMEQKWISIKITL